MVAEVLSRGCFFSLPGGKTASAGGGEEVAAVGAGARAEASWWGGLAAIRRAVFAYPGVKGSESGSRCCRVAVSGGWDELERYGGACQLANLSACWLVGLLACWLVGKSGSWRSAAGFWFTRRVSEEGVASAGAGRRGPAQMGRQAQVSTPGRVAGKEGGKRVWWFTGGVNR